VSVGRTPSLRPPQRFPWALAAKMPARMRSAITSRSYSANPARIVRSKRPGSRAGVEAVPDRDELHAQVIELGQEGEGLGSGAAQPVEAPHENQFDEARPDIPDQLLEAWAGQGHAGEGVAVPDHPPAIGVIPFPRLKIGLLRCDVLARRGDADVDGDALGLHCCTVRLELNL